MQRKLRSLEKEAVEVHQTSSATQQNQNVSSVSCNKTDVADLSRNVSSQLPNSGVTAVCNTPAFTSNGSEGPPLSFVCAVAGDNDGDGKTVQTNAMPDIVKSSSGGTSGTKHVVEAVIENVTVVDDDDYENSFDYNSKNEELSSSPLTSVKGNSTALKDVNTIGTAGIV